MAQFSIGVDMVYIPKIKNLDFGVFEKVFHSHELENNSPEHLAGIWAIKEAFFKAIGEKKDWLKISVESGKNGKPVLHSDLLKKNQNISISISHEKNYAIGIVLLS